MNLIQKLKYANQMWFKQDNRKNCLKSGNCPLKTWGRKPWLVIRHRVSDLAVQEHCEKGRCNAAKSSAVMLLLERKSIISNIMKKCKIHVHIKQD